MKTNGNAKASTITVHIPMKFVVKGGRKTIISKGCPVPPHPRIDQALLKALARAYRWRSKIEGGEYASITELAKAEGVNQSYACRLLRLTLLAPALVVEILNGRQNSNLMLKDLLISLPAQWDQQTKYLASNLAGENVAPS